MFLSTDDGKSWKFVRTLTKGDRFTKSEVDKLIFSTVFDFHFSPDDGYH